MQKENVILWRFVNNVSLVFAFLKTSLLFKHTRLCFILFDVETPNV